MDAENVSETNGECVCGGGVTLLRNGYQNVTICVEVEENYDLQVAKLIIRGNSKDLSLHALEIRRVG